MTREEILGRVMLLIPLLLSLTVHEWAHAWSAFMLGDDTAARQGRLTLNPLAHADPIGTFLLPLLGVPFGWAKPVPVQPSRFRRDVSMTTGMAITAAAGPVSNLFLAVLLTVVYGLMHRWSPGPLEGPLPALLAAAIQINIVLALFNVLPIPPLDGSRIVEAFLPYRFRDTWASFARFAPFALLGVIVFGGFVLETPMRVANELLEQLLLAVAT